MFKSTNCTYNHLYEAIKNNPLIYHVPCQSWRCPVSHNSN